MLSFHIKFAQTDGRTDRRTMVKQYAPDISIQGHKKKEMTSTHIIVIQEHLELSHTNTQVGLIEFIRNIPAKRTKLSPFLYNTVEEAESKEKFSPCMLKKYQY